MKDALEALRRYVLRGMRPSPQGAQTTTDAAGGYVVGEQLNAVLAGYSDEGSAMRRICNPTEIEDGASVPYGILGALPEAQYRDEGEAAEVNADITLTGGVLKFDMLTSKIVAVSRELIQDAGVDIEAELLQPLGIAWALKANAAYTNADAEAPNTQGITESAILADYHAANTVVGEPALPGLQAVRRALPRSVRAGAVWMGSETARDVIEESLSRRHPGASLDVQVNDDMAGAATINANGYDIAAMPAKTALIYANLARYYRIFDAGPFIVERFDDGEYLAKSLIGLRVKRRTTGRLIGPARCAIYAS